LADPGRGVALATVSGFGDRYLAYRSRGGSLFVADQDQALLDESDTDSALDLVRCAEYFAVAELSGAATFFREVRALLPGEMLLVDAHGLRRRALSRPRAADAVELPRWEDYVEHLAALLATAVRRSLAGHERVAIWLSGGLDSAPIAAFAARELGPGGVEAVAWRLGHPAADDGAYVEAAAGALGLKLHWVDCDDALPYSALARWPVHPSTPEQTPYRWFHERSYEQTARLGVPLVLNGFGGDQLYIHARRWFWSLAAGEGVGRAIDRLREAARDVGWRRAIRSQVVGPLLPKARNYRREPPAYLTLTARETLRQLPDWPADAAAARRPAQARRLLSLADARGYAQERWFAARHGLEVRSPLRDQDLVEFMLGVPDHLLHQGTESRPVLRDAIRDLVPESVWRRKTKASFASVLDRGLAPANLPWAERLLLDADAIWRPFVQEPYLRRWLGGDFRDEWDRLGFIHCLNAELWRFKRSGGDLASLAAEH